MSTSGTISKMDGKRKRNALEQRVGDAAVVQQIREEILLFDSKNEVENSDEKVTLLNLWHYHRSPWEFHTERVFGLLGKLDRLEKLCLWHCTSVRVCETILRLPNLKVLEVFQLIPTCLRPPKIPLSASAPSNLERIFLWKVTESDLEHFLFDVLPLAPKLSHFSTSRNNILSFQRIAQRLHNDVARKREWDPDREFIHTITSSEMSSISFPTARLRVLNLGEYEGSKMMKECVKNEEFFEKEKRAINTLLFAYPELQEIGRYDRDLQCYRFHKRIFSSSYTMEINYAGRVLVEGTSTGNPKTLPLSVWPLVLERAWKWCNKIYPNLSDPSPNGIYYLLRNVPPALHSVNQRKPKPNC